MGSHATEHFVTLSERFVIVRKYFVSITATQKRHTGRPKDPVLVGTIGEGEVSARCHSAGAVSGYEHTHNLSFHYKLLPLSTLFMCPMMLCMNYESSFF